jgi:hypothetical protein
MIQKLFCYLGFHKYRTVEIAYCFTTTWTDRPEYPPVVHLVWYERCKCCRKRSARDSHKRDFPWSTTKHAGIEYAKMKWIEYGEMYVGGQRYITPNPIIPLTHKKTKFTVIDGDKK